MKLKMLALSGAAMFLCASAQAQVAYSNGGPAGLNAFTITGGYAVTNSFTLSSTTTITGFIFAGWTDAGTTFTAIDWGISSTHDFAIDGTVSLTPSPVLATGFGFYDIRNYQASVAPLTLAAGTYWLGLQNGITSNGDYAYWDISNGPSVAYQNFIGNVANYAFPGSNSESFSVLSSGVPEAATWVMMVGGFGAAGAAVRRRRTAVRFA